MQNGIIISNPSQTDFNNGQMTLSHEERLAAAKQAFLASEDVLPSSKKTYGESLDRFFAWMRMNGKDINTLVKADIVQYKNDMRMSLLNNQTIRSYLVAVRKFYRWAEDNSIYRNIAKGVTPPRIHEGEMAGEESFVKMDLSEEESIALLKYFKYTRKSLRDFAIVNLMLRCGIRTIEVTRLNIGWIRQVGAQRRMMVWRKGMSKPNPNVTLGLTAPMWEPIEEYLRTRPGALEGLIDDQPLFVTEGNGYSICRDENGREFEKQHEGERMSTRLVQLIIKKGLREIGLDDHMYSAHSLRHTCAVQMLMKGASLPEIQRQLGHTSPNTTMIYLKSYERRMRMQTTPASILDESFEI